MNQPVANSAETSRRLFLRRGAFGLGALGFLQAAGGLGARLISSARPSAGFVAREVAGNDWGGGGETSGLLTVGAGLGADVGGLLGGEGAGGSGGRLPLAASGALGRTVG